MCFQLSFFDFPAAKNFKELLGADLSISETSYLPEVKQTCFWILMEKITIDRTRVKISKVIIEKKERIVTISDPTIEGAMLYFRFFNSEYLHFIIVFWTLFSVCPLNISLKFYFPGKPHLVDTLPANEH